MKSIGGRCGFSSLLLAVALATAACGLTTFAGVVPVALRAEYLVDPVGLEAEQPRLSWRIVSGERGQRQSAYQILVADGKEKLDAGEGNVWDSGRTDGDQTVNIPYAGRPLQSGARYFWKVRVWDRNDEPSPWSPAAQWGMGLLRPTDWQAEWISFRDETPLHRDPAELHLPPARHYRKPFRVTRTVRRATVHASALGLYDLHLNGKRVGDAWFTPGWSDYRERAYYNSFDVTEAVAEGRNCLGAVVADGWYAGYVGYGLLVGYGPYRTGRSFYGKTPALLAQLVIEYVDGSREIVGTDASWEVSGDGPLREADLIMGETFDARKRSEDWSTPAGGRAWNWEPVILARENREARALYRDQLGEQEVDLGFIEPGRLQAYSGPPIRVTEELRAIKVTETAPGVYIYNFGQNFAGVIRLRLKAAAGTCIRLRYGEMLHPDGRLMTENLRRARATDYYIARGDPEGETWTPRFTYHGFQYVELTGLEDPPGLDALTGLVIHSDTPLASSFECSDPMVNQLFRNVVWTQRANFIEAPTDCPQRDERLGWMGDAQVYIRAATYNADVAAFFTKWLDDVEEAQRSFGAYPDYAPYPMAHGRPDKTFATAWTDAGIICPWTLYRVYGDTRVIQRHWESMTRFMAWRRAISPGFGGVAIGNGWGDWLNLNEPTPIEFIDACYFALDARLMAEMARAIGREVEAANYDRLLANITNAFRKAYVNTDGSLKVNTQTAYVLALWVNLVPDELVPAAADRLVDLIQANDERMATGFLGTRSLLPVLTATGHEDLALRLFQSRRFPSWGYPVVNGATTVWERWDSYTKEDGFGRHNAAMNSFSHYAFGAVCQWMFQSLAGIDTDGPGYRRILIRPTVPSRDQKGDVRPIDWVKAEHESVRGRIATSWRRDGDRFELDVSIPANTTATVHLPAVSRDVITESGLTLPAAPHVRFQKMAGSRAVIEVGSGDYWFVSEMPR